MDAVAESEGHPISMISTNFSTSLGNEQANADMKYSFSLFS